jgi:hypothetical protein
MKAVIIREVRQFVCRSNLPMRAVYISMTFLSQLPLVNGDHNVAVQLVDCYISMFEKAIVAANGIFISYPFLKINFTSLTRLRS